ncbi:tape measure protein [Candidatus Gracilibacteria bacterium]|nr:tape measure protein [Candidatus Gracilibacteria bacterium]
MKLGDLIFGVKSDKGQLRAELNKIKYDFKDVGNDIEKSLGKNTIGGLNSRLTTLTSKLSGVKIGSKEFRVLQREIKSTESALQKANGQTTLFTKSLKVAGGFLATIGFAKATSGIGSLSESFTNMGNRLKQVSEGAQLEQLRDNLFQMANQARVPVDDLTASFVRFDLVNKQLGGSQAETLKILDTLSKGLALSGAEANEVSSVMLQLAQAFGSGQLAGDEFRAVSEAMPSLLDILAKQLGVNRGELKDLAAQGVITSDVLKNALLEANEQVNDSFQNSSVTIGQTMTQATNDFIKKFGEIDETYGITEKATTLINGFSNAMISGVSVIGYLVNVASKGFKFIASTIGTSLIGASETVVGVFNTIKNNTGTLVENMGIAFEKLPSAIEKGLKSALNVVGNFIDKVSFGIGGKVSKALGLNSLVDGINIGGGGPTRAFKSFENGFDYSLTKKSNLASVAVFDDFTKALTSFGGTTGKIGTELLRPATGGNRGGGGTGGDDSGGGGASAKDEGKTQEEIEKEILKAKEEAIKKENELLKQDAEQRERRKKYLEDLQEEENKRLKEKVEFISDTVEKITEVYDDELEKSSDIIDDYIKNIEKLEDTLLNLAEESKKIKEDLFKFGSTDTQADLEELAERYKAILAVAGNDETLEGGVKVGDLRDFVKEKQRQTEIEVERQAAENELESLREKKLQEQIIFSEFSNKRAAIDENYKQLRQSIEVQITDTVYQESLKQESYQNRLISKWQAVAAARRAALSGGGGEGSSGAGFYEGGYTGDGPVTGEAGTVHYKEYVIPHDIVKKVPETISQLERMRQGNQSFDNSKNINVPNITVTNQIDLETVFDKLKFRL